MIAFKILVNISFLFLGLYGIISTVGDIKSKRYPLWMSICDIVAYVLYIMSSFAVWFIN